MNVIDNPLLLDAGPRRVTREAARSRVPPPCRTQQSVIGVQCSVFSVQSLMTGY